MKTTVPRNIKNIALDWLDCRYIMDFSDHSVVRNPPANKWDKVSISGPGRAPGRRNDNPLQYSCLRNPMDRGAWWAKVHSVWVEHHSNWTTVNTLLDWLKRVFFWFFHNTLWTNPNEIFDQPNISMCFHSWKKPWAEYFHLTFQSHPPPSPLSLFALSEAG